MFGYHNSMFYHSLFLQWTQCSQHWRKPYSLFYDMSTTIFDRQLKIQFFYVKIQEVINSVKKTLKYIYPKTDKFQDI